MKTKNTYQLPIVLAHVTKVAKEGIAHVGDLIHSIDYDAPIGTPITAALDGVVIAIKQDSDQGGGDPKYENDGNYIEILHENDEVSEYEHILQHSAKVKIGDGVKKGQVIASVGNTGWSECPHLHFMVYPKGEEYKTLEIQFESEEFVDLVDKEGRMQKTQVLRSEVSKYPNLHMQIVIAVILDNQQRILVHKRASTKKVDPGAVDHVCGGVQSGETPIEAAIRETTEETGLVPCNLKVVMQGLNSYGRYRYLLLGEAQGEPSVDPKEAEWVRFISVEDLRNLFESKKEAFVHEFFKDTDLAIRATV